MPTLVSHAHSTAPCRAILLLMATNVLTVFPGVIQDAKFKRRDALADLAKTVTK